MATATVSPGWSQLRQQVRQLEGQTENALNSFSQFSSISNITPQPTEEEKSTETRVEELLEKRHVNISHLARILDSESVLTSSAIKQSNLLLFREKLVEHQNDLGRLRASLKTARDRANLLTSVRGDIDAAQRGRSANNSGAPEAEYMLDERRRLDESNVMADSVLSQAYAVNDSFSVQRDMLYNVNKRITLAASQVPGINSILGRISAKKQRDGIILGAFIGLCFMLFWWLS